MSSATEEELLAQLTPEQRARLPQMYVNTSRRALENQMRLTIENWREMAEGVLARGRGAAAAQPWLDMAALLEQQLPEGSGVVAEAEAVQ